LSNKKACGKKQQGTKLDRATNLDQQEEEEEERPT
jgi:hypothetical protein